MGRGERFVVLLDDDKSGRKEAQRYKDNWFLKSDVILTLGELDAAFAGKQLEGLLTDETQAIAKAHLGTAGAPTKKQLGWYLAEMCAAENLPTPCLAAEAVSNLSRVLSMLDAKFT